MWNMLGFVFCCALCVLATIGLCVALFVAIAGAIKFWKNI